MDAIATIVSMTTTTIQIDVEVREELRARGRMGASYNDVIRELLAATRSREGALPEPAPRTAKPSPKPLFAR
jgi:hypothetical protein